MLSKILAFIFSFFFICNVYAADKKQSVIDADEVFYDKKLDEIIAKGNVEVFRDNILINSDKLIYNKKTNTIMATGHVRVVDDTGEEYFGEELEFLRDLKKLIIYSLQSKIDEKLHIGAKSSTYLIDKKILRLKKASITTCEVCKNKKPQWVFNSGRVKYVEKDERIHHYNSFVELYGIPVAYVPYFSHLAPGAKPRSGFLFPGYKYKTIYGNGLEVKYYQRLSESADLLYKPIISQKEGVIHQAKYNQLFNNADLKLEGSYVNMRKRHAVVSDFDTKNVKNRYNLKGYYHGQLSDVFSAKIDVDRVSDKAYLRQFFTQNQNYLTTDAKLEYQNNRDFGSMRTLFFQGLRVRDYKKTTPHALPLINFHKEKFYANNNFTFDINSLSLMRDQGADLNRVSSAISASRHLFFDNGLSLNNMLFLRGDAYKYRDLSTVNRQNGVKDSLQRVLPLYELKLNYPLGSEKWNYISVINPVVQFIASPNMSKNSMVINEDSLNIEINDSNLFQTNRYSGFDKFEDGTRVNYGINGTTASKNNLDRSYFYMLGQSYKFRKKNNYDLNSGMNGRFSDYVGHLGLRPLKNLTMLYRFRVDQTNFTPRRNELRLNYHYNKLNVGTNLVKYNYLQHDENTVNRSFGVDGKYQYDKEWSVSGYISSNATPKKSFLIGSGFGVVYDGQCSYMSLNLRKDYTRSVLNNNNQATSIIFDFIPKGLS